jgi:hypothetical protein
MADGPTKTTLKVGSLYRVKETCTFRRLDGTGGLISGGSRIVMCVSPIKVRTKKYNKMSRLDPEGFDEYVALFLVEDKVMELVLFDERFERTYTLPEEAIAETINKHLELLSEKTNNEL